jgi:hypothetical protein
MGNLVSGFGTVGIDTIDIHVIAIWLPRGENNWLDESLERDVRESECTAILHLLLSGSTS